MDSADSDTLNIGPDTVYYLNSLCRNLRICAFNAWLDKHFNNILLTMYIIRSMFFVNNCCGQIRYVFNSICYSLLPGFLKNGNKLLVDNISHASMYIRIS